MSEHNKYVNLRMILRASFGRTVDAGIRIAELRKAADGRSTDKNYINKLFSRKPYASDQLIATAILVLRNDKGLCLDRSDLELAPNRFAKQFGIPREVERQVIEHYRHQTGAGLAEADEELQVGPRFSIQFSTSARDLRRLADIQGTYAFHILCIKNDRDAVERRMFSLSIDARQPSGLQLIEIGNPVTANRSIGFGGFIGERIVAWCFHPSGEYPPGYLCLYPPVDNYSPDLIFGLYTDVTALPARAIMAAKCLLVRCDAADVTNAYLYENWRYFRNV